LTLKVDIASASKLTSNASQAAGLMQLIKQRRLLRVSYKFRSVEGVDIIVSMLLTIKARSDSAFALVGAWSGLADVEA
jgi:hypothetical protein